MTSYVCSKCGVPFEHDDTVFFVDRINGNPACKLCHGMVTAISLGFPKLKKAQEEYEADQARKRKMISGDGYV